MMSVVLLMLLLLLLLRNSILHHLTAEALLDILSFFFAGFDCANQAPTLRRSLLIRLATHVNSGEPVARATCSCSRAERCAE